jgi:hypothetical protein
MGPFRHQIYEVLCEKATVALRSARQRFPATGLAGGESSALGAFIRNPGTDAETKLPSTRSSTPLVRGDVLRGLASSRPVLQPRPRDGMQLASAAPTKSKDTSCTHPHFFPC